LQKHLVKYEEDFIDGKEHASWHDEEDLSLYIDRRSRNAKRN